MRRALAAVFGGAVGKDMVSRVWRKVKSDWDAWNRRDLAAEPIVRLILDGTVVRVRLDRKATSISLLVVLGVRRDGQKVLLAVKNMGGESEAAWRAVLDDLVARGLQAPELRHRRWRARPREGAGRALGRGADPALHRPQAPQPAGPCPRPAARRDLGRLQRHDLRRHAKEIEQRRRAFLRKWRLKCQAVADSLEEAGDRLFTFTRLPPSQWKSARTTNAVERLHEEFKRRIKTQTVLPSAETAAMLFWALLASGQITMRKVDGWQTLAETPAAQTIDLAA